MVPNIPTHGVFPMVINNPTHGVFPMVPNILAHGVFPMVPNIPNQRFGTLSELLNGENVKTIANKKEDNLFPILDSSLSDILTMC
jgi:hypothetical protein